MNQKEIVSLALVGLCFILVVFQPSVFSLFSFIAAVTFAGLILFIEKNQNKEVAELRAELEKLRTKITDLSNAFNIRGGR